MMMPNLLILCMQVRCWDKSPIVETGVGKIKGQIKTTSKGNSFTAFEGIPYAEPPIGELRFKIPFPPKQWDGVLDANVLHECVQVNENDNIIGDEDCLYLNAYIPNEKPTANQNLDVVVYLQSEEFQKNPENLLDKNLAVVTVNYRLGILGFLSTEDHILPGNMGLKDQVMALQWIQNNIASFGGNPNSVTLIGDKFGAASVHLHYFSKQSEGFSISASALNPWVLQKNAANKAEKLALSLKCETNSTEIMIECLRDIPVDQIMSKMYLFSLKGFPIFPFGAVLENSKTSFLTDHPYFSLKEGKFNDAPWIASSNQNEALKFCKNVNIKQLNMLWKIYAPTMLDFKNTLCKSKWNKVSNSILGFYLNHKQRKIITEDVLVDILSDRFFLVDVESAIMLHAEARKSKVYYLRFNYKSDNDLTQEGVSGLIVPDLSNKETPSKDELMVELFANIVVSYARSSIPIIDGTVWPPVSGEQIDYLNITSPEAITIMKSDEISPRTFWTSLGLKENYNLFNKDVT